MTTVATMRTKASEPKTRVVPKPKEEQRNTNMEAEIRTKVTPRSADESAGRQSS